MDGSSVYMCYPCYQEFSSLEEVLAHQLTCTPEEAGIEAPGLQLENVTEAQASPSLMEPSDQQAERQGPTDETHSRGGPDSDPQIQYQCGDCGFLFGSLNLWQQHCKLGKCLLAEEEPGGGANELDYAELVAGQHEQQLTEAGKQTSAQIENQVEAQEEVAGPVQQLIEAVGQAAGHVHQLVEADAHVVVHIEQLVEDGGQSAGHSQQLVEADYQAAGHTERLIQTDKLGEVVRGEEWTSLEEGGESGTEMRMAVGTGSWRTVKVEQLQREFRERERAVSQDHAYLQCDEASESGGLEAAGTDEQKMPEKATAEVNAEIIHSASEKEDDKIQDENGASRKRENRKSKVNSVGVSSQSLLCVDCGCGFSLVPELVAHRRTHHDLEGALHRCSICGESFLNTTLFLYHRRQHRKKEEEGQVEEETPEEEERSTGAVERTVYADHILETGTEAEPDILEVETERIQVVTEENVTFSMTVEAGNEEQDSDNRGVPVGGAAAPAEVTPSFLCVACGSGFSTELELAEHRKAQHALGEALHRCNECGQEFMNTTLFLYHRREHREGSSEKGFAEATDMNCTPGAPKRVGLLSSAPVTPKRTSSPALTLLRKRQRGHSGSDVTKDDDSTGTTKLQKHDALPEAQRDSLPAPPELYRDWSRTPLPHTCPHCGRTFTRRCLLRAHVFSHTGEKLFSCKVCGKAFTCSSNLMRHSRTHLGGRPYTCECCGKTFSQSSTLKRHQFTHATEDGGGQRPYTCDDCPSRFQTRAQLQRHRLQHTGNPFSCSRCGQSFKRKRQLDLHSLTHQEEQPQSCPHCAAQFRSQSVLNVHLRRCSGEDDRARGRGRGQGRGRSVGQLECDMCGHCCVTQEGLDLHRLSHTGQTPLRCPLSPCRRRFATSAALEAHVLAHCKQLATKGPSSAPRPFRCEHCGKGFAYASTFRLHMRIHTGERPYECSQCGKRFRQLPHLQDHERIHSGERPFSCWVCGKSFSVAARLTEHARTHSGEKPYACTLCPRTFRSRSNLDKHIKVHGGSATARDLAGEGEAAVRTILLVQTPAHIAEGSNPVLPGNPSEAAVLFPGTASSVVLLHPSIAVVDGQDIQHAVEFIIEETV